MFTDISGECIATMKYKVVATSLPYSSTLKMMAVCSSDMWINLYQTIHHHIPENIILPG
jgi:hypothetical protein